MAYVDDVIRQHLKVAAIADDRVGPAPRVTARRGEAGEMRRRRELVEAQALVEIASDASQAQALRVAAWEMLASHPGRRQLKHFDLSRTRGVEHIIRDRAEVDGFADFNGVRYSLDASGSFARGLPC